MKNLKNNLTVAAALAQHMPHKKPCEIASFIEDLDKMGAALNRRYLASCNHKWATTEAYEKRTDKMEDKLCKMVADFSGVVVTLQRDPRGWPVVITIDDCDFYLGGR